MSKRAKSTFKIAKVGNRIKPNYKIKILGKWFKCNKWLFEKVAERDEKKQLQQLITQTRQCFPDYDLNDNEFLISILEAVIENGKKEKEN